MTEQGAEISRVRGRIVCKKGSTKLQSSRLEELDRLVLFGNIHITHQALRGLLSHRVDVVMLTLGGKYLGRLVGPSGANGRLRHQQHLLFEDLSVALGIAKRCIAGKIYNQRRLLQRAKRRRPSQTLAAALVQLRVLHRQAEAAEELEVLRGYEGRAAAVYFGVFGELLSPSGFTFERRARRPPPDPVNILLSLGYTLLTNFMQSLLELASLDPYYGVLHQQKHGMPSLALDLIEEWRPLIVDSLVLELCNGGTLHPRDFRAAGPEDPPSRPIVMSPIASKRWFARYEQRLNQRVLYPPLEAKLRYRQILREQVFLLARQLRGEGLYAPFLGGQ